MAVPSSGKISLAGLKAEIAEEYDATHEANTSLKSIATETTFNSNSSSVPNATAPHAMSEWYSYDHDAAASFADNYAVAKSITTGSAQSIRIADGNGFMNYTEDDAFSISFWVKPMWSSSLNTNIHLFSSNETGSSNASSNMIRCFYHEANNRLYWEYRGSSSSTKKQNFWLFHSNGGNHAAAYAAANLGSTYWSATNRGNTGDDDFIMITFTKGSADSFANTNINCYWNATSLGNGHYPNGLHQGTINMSSSTDRQIAMGSNTWNTYSKSGNSAETQFNDLTVWNKKLSASEVSELYNSGARMNALTHSAASDLEGYYKFENDGTDSSGNNHPSFVVNGNSNFESI
tara:strand:+ start:2704 stop:3744 length:1041 start_codon:yes stop_codon:yes gene_type:complete